MSSNQINKNINIKNILPNNISKTQWQSVADATKPVSNKVAVADLNAKKRAERKLEQEIASLKNFINENVAETWLEYQKQFPEAFENNSRLKRMTPQVIFYGKVEDIQKQFPDITSGTVAFVCSAEPNRIYFNITLNLDDIKKIGSKEIKATIAHELMHSLNNNTINRIQNDLKGKELSYKDVRRDLNQMFTLPYIGHKNENIIFSVADLLKEGSADILSINAIGQESQHTPYKPFREISKKLLQRVTLRTYKKAFLENDSAAYMSVIKAALELKTVYDRYYNKHIRSNPFKRVINRVFKDLNL